MPLFSIVIPAYNRKRLIAATLDSILSQEWQDFEVIVVDNASYDGCVEMVKSEFPQVIFFQSDQNLGFAGANNLAFSRSQGRNVLFLNPDTEIQGNALQALVSSLESIPPAGMVGARLLNSDLTLQTTCVVAFPSILNQALSSAYLRRTFPKWGFRHKVACQLAGFRNKLWTKAHIEPLNILRETKKSVSLTSPQIRRAP